LADVSDSEHARTAQAVRVTGSPTAEELAAVIAALVATEHSEAAPTGYQLWRRTRVQALAARA
jgi:hypothetical protein